ncbi:hypothetical protein AN479_23705 [Serratia marcescens]|uniref:DUF2971 domain-containing protein n=1 Tax=Serratia marcescens TaxID=615 RepID=UPI0006BD008F|nr:DUF2971 domain-containing protein [Serratia marcescens]ALD42910.1 hypothetical protein AN479_00115 [Serratia marcescens]ALD47245.1 hypothetical protein AN479_23705 [Serratia marcescens]
MFKFYPPNEYALKNIVDNTIYMSPVQYFNDPYELDCKVERGFPSLDSDSPRLQHILEAWLGDNVDMTLVNEHYEEFTSGLFEADFSNGSYRSKVRVACFTRNPMNALMWAYYSASMSGICVEFDEAKLIEVSDTETQIFDVVYSEESPVVDTAVLAVWDSVADYYSDVYDPSHEYEKNRKIYDEGYSLSVKSIREIYQKLIATKFSAWEREDEVRMVRFINGDIRNEDGYILSLPENAIKSVILGPNIPSAYKAQLLQTLQARDIPSKAMLKSGNYRWELKTIHG